MFDDLDAAKPTCPMCGATISAHTNRCPDCGEWLSENRLDDSLVVDAELVRKFRREMHGLAGFWIVFGLLGVAAGVAIIAGVSFLSRGFAPDELKIIGGIALFFALCWVVAGFACAYKQKWGIYLGLVVSYINLAGHISQINVCGLIISVLVIVQGHRCLKFAKQMHDAGIPLTYKT